MTDNIQTQFSPTQNEQSGRAEFNKRDLLPRESFFSSLQRLKGRFSHPHCSHSTPHNAHNEDIRNVTHAHRDGKSKKDKSR